MNEKDGRTLPESERLFSQYVAGAAHPIADIFDPDRVDDLLPLRELAEQSRVCMYGESHGIVENYHLGTKILRYLHTLGYRTLVLESDWAYTDLLNEYLAEGDEELLLGMDSWGYPNAGNNQESLEFYRSLYRWNQTLPEGEKIRIWCTDVSHGTKTTVKLITKGIRELFAPEIADELVDLLDAATNPKPVYAKLAEFEKAFDQRTQGTEQTEGSQGIPVDEGLRLHIRVLKDTAAWKEVEGNTDLRAEVARDYPGVEEIREEASLAIWRYNLRHHDFDRDGKILFYGGSWHTPLEVKEERCRLAILLNETVPCLLGQVFTIASIALSGHARMKHGEHKDMETRLGESAIWQDIRKIPHRWFLAVNKNMVPDLDGDLYSVNIFMKDCQPARSRPSNGE